MLNPNPLHMDGVDPGELFAGIEGVQKIGLAVSGGPDSLALMLLVRAWCDLRGGEAPEVFVYSVDHGLRPESADEAEFTVQTAQGFGFAGCQLVWQGDKPATGIQAAARAARYRLIGGAMAKDGVSALLTAHHSDDQAETILMRMAHGSGITGLGGMAVWAEIEGVKVHRPLLNLRHAALQNIVTRSGLKPVLDPSNSDPHYERVRWRQAAPTLEAQGLTSAGLSRLAQRFQRADFALTEMTNAAVKAHVTRDQFGVAHLSLVGFTALSAEIGLRVLAHMFTSVGRDNPRLEQLEVLHTKLGRSTFSGTCLSGAQVQLRSGAIAIFAEAGRMVPSPVDIAPGEKCVWDARFEIHNRGTVGVRVLPSTGLSRTQAEKFVGGAIGVPMAALASAPSIYNANSMRIALGLFTRSQDLEITLVG